MWEKRKKKEPPNVKKELSHVMLKLQNVRMEPSNVRNKIREPPNVTKKTITCDVGTAMWGWNRQMWEKK